MSLLSAACVCVNRAKSCCDPMEDDPASEEPEGGKRYKNESRREMEGIQAVRLIAKDRSFNNHILAGFYFGIDHFENSSWRGNSFLSR